MVHWFVLSCCHGKYLPVVLCICILGTQPLGQTGTHSNALSDRNWNLQNDSAAGRSSSVGSRSLIVGDRSYRFPPANTWGVDSTVRGDSRPDFDLFTRKRSMTFTRRQLLERGGALAIGTLG